MSKKYHGYISYKIKPSHKDYRHDLKDKYMTYEDVYTLSVGYHIDDMRSVIKRDLLLVAGGGYDWVSIYDYNIIIKEIKDGIK